MDTLLFIYMVLLGLYTENKILYIIHFYKEHGVDSPMEYIIVVLKYKLHIQFKMILKTTHETGPSFWLLTSHNILTPINMFLI